MTVTPEKTIQLDKNPTIHGVRPAVDITLQSVATVFGKATTVAILTGMGKDGADGCRRIEQYGGKVIVQDEASCVVYGMPKAARERTEHAIEAPLEKIAEAIFRSVPAGANH